jgi:hypothetical protein
MLSFLCALIPSIFPSSQLSDQSRLFPHQACQYIQFVANHRYGDMEAKLDQLTKTLTERLDVVTKRLDEQEQRTASSSALSVDPKEAGPKPLSARISKQLAYLSIALVCPTLTFWLGTGGVLSYELERNVRIFYACVAVLFGLQVFMAYAALTEQKGESVLYRLLFPARLSSSSVFRYSVIGAALVLLMLVYSWQYVSRYY